VLTGADVLPAQYEPPRGIHVMLGIGNPADAERIFQAMAAGGAIKVPLQKTFWAARFGSLVDQFGIPWQINCGTADAG
jgi:PhnB protein